MAARVLHLGEDDCHRVSILESAGYRVELCKSLAQFLAALHSGTHFDALFLTEREGVSPEEVAALARSHSTAPLILFRTSNRRAPEKQFNLVVNSLDPPEQWLKQVAAVLENCPGSPNGRGAGSDRRLDTGFQPQRDRRLPGTGASQKRQIS